MSQPRIFQKIKRNRIFLLLVWGLLVVLCLIVGKANLSSDADVSELYFCGDKDQSGKLLTIIDELNPTNRPQKLSICGYALTDGRPAPIVILIFFEDKDQLIYSLPGGVMVPDGSFTYELPSDIMQEPGDYRVEAIFAHRVLIARTIKVVK